MVYKHIITLFAILSIFTASAFAKEKTYYVTINQEGKASFKLTNLTREDSQVLLNQEDSFGHNTIIDKDGSLEWSDKSVEELNQVYNHQDCTPDIEIIDNKEDAMKLFPEQHSGDIAPTSGTWQPKITSHNVKGCPPMMKSAINQAKLDTTTKTVQFSKPFHPNDFFDPKEINPHGDPNVQWINPQPNFWKVTVMNNQQGMKLNVTWDLKVTSKTTMDVSSHLLMKFPKEVAMVMGGSECRVDSSGILERIGN